MDKNINKLIDKKQWEYLVMKCLPVNVADSLSFYDAMRVVDDLTKQSTESPVWGTELADFMRDFSVNLMIILRARYPKEWSQDWKNEVFLGIWCGLVYREEEAFVYIKNAYEKKDDPPQSLILAYLGSGNTCDSPFSKEERCSLVDAAIKKGITYESALAMASIAREELRGDEAEMWAIKAEEAKKNGVHTPIIVPDSLKEASQLDDDYKYEN